MSPRHIQMPPPKAISTVCDALEDVVFEFFEQQARLSVGRYEADVEALLMFKLGVRQVQGVLALARSDLVLLPAAVNLARGAFEACVRAAWMVNDPDPMKREGRYIAQLNSEIESLRKMRERHDGKDAPPSDRESGLVSFRDGFSKMVQDQGVDITSRAPAFDQVLKSLDSEELYRLYQHSSNYTHGGHAATWIYRRGGVGINKEIGEFISATDWFLPLWTCWLALGFPGDLLVARLVQSKEWSPWSPVYEATISAAFDGLRTEVN